MRQQTITVYICDLCNKEYRLKEGAESCEAKHKANGLVSIKDHPTEEINNSYPGTIFIEDLRE